ncbi:MAG: preprotein translocase subunit SecE [Phycisphaerae bacterium]
MIATEGEMKKVSWSTRREVIGSTKVVIAVVIMLAVMLFVVDTVFAVFFNFIDVLKILEIKQLLGLG